jgi:hypothetical protein
LASSRGTSNGPDVLDWVTYWAAFEVINGCRLVLETSLVDHRGEAVRFQRLTAWERKPESGVQPPLVLASVDMRVEGKMTMAAATLQLLYLLDGKLAAGEFAKIIKPA